MEIPFPCAEPLEFEEDDVYMVSRSFQFVVWIQGKPNYPHYAKQLKSNNKNPETRRKLKQFVPSQNEFKICM